MHDINSWCDLQNAINSMNEEKEKMENTIKHLKKAYELSCECISYTITQTRNREYTPEQVFNYYIEIAKNLMNGEGKQ